jgi:deazaflavin-dependent oxidoreductase (nitroreductase family)
MTLKTGRANPGSETKIMAENPMSEEEVKRFRKFLKPFSKLNSVIYKLTGGRVMGRLRGRPVMLVTMTGAKSGQPRTIPLMYVPYKEGVIVVASQGGSPRSPVWTHNLIAHPDIVVQYKSKKMDLRARRADEAEKALVWPTCVEHYPEYDDYQKRTDRSIPVFVCEPR